MLLVQIAGLLATCWIVWSISLEPRLSRDSLSGIVLQVASYTLLVCLSGAAITLGLYLLVARSFHQDAVRMALRTSGTAVWFASATVLLAEMSPATLPAALVLVVSATRLLHSQWRLVHADLPAPVTAPFPRPFFDPPPAPRLRELVPGLAASFAIQTGLVLFAGLPLLAASCFSLSVSMITLCALQAGAFDETTARVSLPRSILGFLLTLILAAGLTVGSLAGHLDSTSTWRSPFLHRPGPLQSARALLHELMNGGGDQSPDQTATNIVLPPAGAVEYTDNSFPGVVLLSEAPASQPILIAPVLPSLRSPPDAPPIQPFTIPFSGEYWMYRPPYRRPPPTSHVQKGNPVALSFRTTDRSPLEMEARQKLARAISLACCSEIRIAISSLDRFPATVALELILIDSKAAGWPSLSLGNVPVTARPSPTMPASAILPFRIPRPTPLREFDQFRVIFHRDRLRAEHSARISIGGFVLVPRGA